MSSASRVLPFSSAPQAAPGPTLVQAAEASQLLLGPSGAVSSLWAQIRRIAPYFRTALLTGETGTGAHAAARALHDLSPASHSIFIALTCAEAEDCFGHGRFEPSPQEGTYFLSDIQHLSRTGQTGLMRLLRRRGSHSVRVIAFAERGLRPAISTGTFSSELAASLTAVRIALPALRERPEDIPQLANHLLQTRAEALALPVPPLAPDFLPVASRYAWPGNLDQLAAVLTRLLQTASSEPLTAAALEIAVAGQASAAPPAPTRMIKLHVVVQEHIRAVLFACNGNKLRAAETLGISRSTLYRMLEETGQPENFAETG